jgi:hypothetical protein
MDGMTISSGLFSCRDYCDTAYRHWCLGQAVRCLFRVCTSEVCHCIQRVKSLLTLHQLLLCFNECQLYRKFCYIFKIYRHAPTSTLESVLIVHNIIDIFLKKNLSKLEIFYLGQTKTIYNLERTE